MCGASPESIRQSIDCASGNSGFGFSSITPPTLFTCSTFCAAMKPTDNCDDTCLAKSDLDPHRQIALITDVIQGSDLLSSAVRRRTSCCRMRSRNPSSSSSTPT